jgi:hypothetical protein
LLPIDGMRDEKLNSMSLYTCSNSLNKHRFSNKMIEMLFQMEIDNT